MISYCHKLDVCLCVSLLLVYPDETARPGPSEWRTFGMADRYRLMRVKGALLRCPLQFQKCRTDS